MNGMQAIMIEQMEEMIEERKTQLFKISQLEQENERLVEQIEDLKYQVQDLLNQLARIGIHV